MREPKTSTRSRREILKIGAIGAVVGAALDPPSALAQSSAPARHTFVLVHGAWHGGWCWRRVADILEGRGHKVYTPTLTGLGERSHLMTSSINLDTHIADIVNIFKWEDLNNAVLCGHSYAGWVVSGAIEYVQPQVSSLVFLDAFVPEDGQTGFDIAPEPNHTSIEQAIRTGAISRPAPPAESFRVNPKDRAWVDGKMTPQPLGVALQKIKMTGARDRVPKRTYIRALNYPSPRFDQYLANAKANKGWRTYEVPSGHDVMVDMPERLAQILVDVA
jgi:pimeloyl-ACP methyl ester carboxylesterase